jgi:hypothetical protein
LRHNTTHALAILATLAALATACGEDKVSNPPPPPPSAGPDITNPQSIDDLALEFDSLANAIVFRWTARRDDDDNAVVHHYDLRYSTSLPFDWATSTRVVELPDPFPAGTVQQATLALPHHGEHYFAAIRSVDAAGNQSGVVNLGSAFVPGFLFDLYCYDTLSDAPIAALDVAMTTSTIRHYATGPDGHLTLRDLARGPVDLEVTRGSASFPYHGLHDAFVLTNENLLVSFPMIPFQQPQSVDYTSILDLLDGAITSPGADEIIRIWKSFPVQWYAPAFVNVNGLDYFGLAKQAAERWNTRLGFQLFELVPSNPAVGISMEFVPYGSIGPGNALTSHESDDEFYPIHDRIQVVDNFADEPRLYSIFMHELGHTLRLGHLGAGFIMFGSQPLPSDISDDEVTMVKLMLALPNGTNLSKYDSSPPPP